MRPGRGEDTGSDPTDAANGAASRRLPPSARRLALAMAGLALIGLGISIYLTALKLAGEVPLCVVGGGCESVQTSRYSVLLGIPVAAYGAAWSAVALAAAIAWFRTANRRALLVLYVGGLAGTLFEGYLLYLELFVIHAVCSWCAAYGITVVAGWLLTLPALRTGERLAD